MKEFIMANWLDIVVILGALGIAYGLLRAGKKEVVRKFAYNITKQADMKYDATPDEKFQTIYDLLPKTVRLLYSLKDIRKIVDDIFTELEDALDGVDNDKEAQG